MSDLARLAETLLPLLSDSEEGAIEMAQAAIGTFGPRFEAAYTRGLRAKLGLTEERLGDLALAHDLLERMAANEADFTLTFRALSEAAADAAGDDAVRPLFRDPSAFDAWAVSWRRRLAAEGGDPARRRETMRRTNPRYIPRNHRVEEAIDAAVERADLAPFERLLAVLAAPFDEQPENASYAAAPRPDEVVHQTFCGT